jgi:hypothetical protein
MGTRASLAWVLRTLRQAAWAPLLVLGLFLAAVGLFDAYARLPALDKPTHFLGGAAVAHFFWCGWGQAGALGGPLPKVGQPAFALGGTAVTALLWEVCEFLADRFLATRMQHGLVDTLSDVLFGLAGGAIYLLLRRSRTASLGARASPERADEGP